MFSFFSSYNDFPWLQDGNSATAQLICLQRRLLFREVIVSTLWPAIPMVILMSGCCASSSPSHYCAFVMKALNAIKSNRNAASRDDIIAGFANAVNIFEPGQIKYRVSVVSRAFSNETDDKSLVLSETVSGDIGDNPPSSSLPVPIQANLKRCCGQ